MCIYNSTQIRPYVYLCIHRVTGQIYIGYREKNVKLNLTSDVDFPLYRTSSKIVNPNFDEYDWYIVAEFETGADAYDFEQQLIFENWDNPLLLNESCRYGSRNRFKAISGEKCSRPGELNGMYGKEQSNSTKQLIAAKAKGKALAKDAITGEHLGRISLDDPRWVTGIIVGQTRGRKESAETKMNKSITTKGILKGPQAQATCPHCTKTGGISLMNRWHFDNCKSKH